MQKVELATPTSILRAPNAEDADAIAAACQDADIQRWVPVPVPYGFQDALSYVSEVSDAGWASGSTCTWSIISSNHFAGVISLDRILNGQATIGFWMAPEHRRKGILAEALEAVVDFAFAPTPDGLALQRIEWHAYVGNVASARVASKAGFKFEGTLRLGAQGRGFREDDWVAGLLSGDPRTPAVWSIL